MPDVFILSATRTPIGAFQGALASVAAPRLGAAVVRSAVEQAGLDRESVSHVLMGCVLQAGLGQAPARQAALYAGLPASTRAVTINKVCGSGMQAVIDASYALRCGAATFAVAGGMESMSGVPYLLPKARSGYRLGHGALVDALLTDGLWDPYGDAHMGSCAERCASKYSFSRADQEAYARASFERAMRAQHARELATEITPVDVPGGQGRVSQCADDEGPRRADFAKMPSLKPAFEAGGTITAATASTLNDGAAALVLCTEDGARTAPGTPLARIVSFGEYAQAPEWFTTSPVAAVRHALTAAGWRVSDVDLWEVNEAFAVVAMAFMRDLDIPHDIVNVRGGAIALGHPIGCSGARILVTLISTLRQRGLTRGVAAICIGGGEGLAACVEVL